MSSEQAAAVATVLESLGDAASLWFAFGGDPSAPTLVLADRSADPRGQTFVPKVKELAALGTVAQGIATRKDGGPLGVVSRVPFDGLVTALAAWAATHVAQHPHLATLKGLTYTLVSKQNEVLGKQDDPDAWAALDQKPEPEPQPETQSEPAPAADPQAAAVAAVLENIGDAASLWFAFGGDPSAPTLVLADRSADPRGQTFVPKVKELAALGTVAQGIATRKDGGPLSLVSRQAYPGLIAQLAAWTATHVASLSALRLLRDARFSQVDKTNAVVDKQDDPLVWEAVDEALGETAPAQPSASAEQGEPEAADDPQREPDPYADAAADALYMDEASYWLWLSAPPDDADEPPTLILVSRDDDPKGQLFGATVKEAFAAGVPREGGLQGMLSFKDNKPPMVVSRGAYAGFVGAMVRWHAAWSHLDGAGRIKGIGFTQVGKDKSLVDRQLDPGAWEEAAVEAARATGEEVHIETEAEKSGSAVASIEGEGQLWFWMGRNNGQVEVVLRSVDGDPTRSGFDRGVTQAREALGDGFEEVVGRARRDAGGGFRFASLSPFAAFTASLKQWVGVAGADSAALGALVGSRFQYTNNDGAVFNEQAWPRGPVGGSRRDRDAETPDAGEGASSTATGAGLPVSDKQGPAQRALDGTRVNLDPARADVTESIAEAASLEPRKLQQLAQDVEALSGIAESWIEQLADLDDARFATRALRREAWSSDGPAPELDHLPVDPADAADALADLDADLQDAADAAKDWRQKAQGPPLSARNPLELPALSLPNDVKVLVEAILARESALDALCASDSPGGDRQALADLDEEAADARDALLNPLLDMAADAGEASIALRRACDKLESHGEFRNRFPGPMRERFDTRLREAYTGLKELGEALLWLTRPRD